MFFNSHFHLKDKHAFLSASNYHWVNYDDEKLDQRFESAMSAALGTRLHNLAKELIELGIKLPNNSKTLNRYVNDAIGYRMKPEVILYYSDNCFGTADAISFKKNLLRIHDLKNGVTPTKETQLEVYAALFCLEYRYKPHEIDIELRIYQSDEVRVYEGDPDTILHIMDKIKTFDKRLEALTAEALL